MGPSNPVRSRPHGPLNEPRLCYRPRGPCVRADPRAPPADVPGSPSSERERPAGVDWPSSPTDTGGSLTAVGLLIVSLVIVL